MKVIKPAAALSAGAFSRASTATYVDAAGVIQTAGVNVPRYQDGVLMVETGTINSVLHSSDMTAGSWSKSSTAIDPNTATAPDGSVTADTALVTASSSGGVFVTFTVTASTAYTFSFWALRSAAAAAAYRIFDATNVANIALVQYYDSLDPAEWVRVVVPFTTPAGCISVRCYPCADGGSGLAYGAQLWGSQMEPGLVATSYIPTAGSAIGRLSDVYTPGVISSVPETDHAAWVAATAYTVGNRVIRTSTHRIYERVVAGTTATAPELDAINWTDIGPTNAWAMLDGEVSTATTATGGIQMTIAPGRVSGLALFGLVGSSVSVAVVDGDVGAVVYQASTQLDSAVIQDWLAYVYEPFRQQTEWVLSDLPPYSSARISIVISGAVTACAALVVGTVYALGGTLIGPRLGIADYSRKETDEFGAATFVRRNYAKRLTCEILLATVDMAGVLAVLVDLRATPAVYIASETAELNPLLIYGWYRDFGITVAYATRCLCSLDLEGLT